VSRPANIGYKPAMCCEWVRCTCPLSAHTYIHRGSRMTSFVVEHTIIKVCACEEGMLGAKVQRAVFCHDNNLATILGRIRDKGAVERARAHTHTRAAYSAARAHTHRSTTARARLMACVCDF
jgi:hypothetical protein